MCTKQYFGPGYQHYDVDSESIKQFFATDGDRTCNLVVDATSTVNKWNATYASHWIRVVLESPGQFHNFRLWLNSLELCQWKTFSCEWSYSRCLLHHLCSFDPAGALRDSSRHCVLQLCHFQPQFTLKQQVSIQLISVLKLPRGGSSFKCSCWQHKLKSQQLLYMRLTKNSLGGNSSWIDLTTWHRFTYTIETTSSPDCLATIYSGNTENVMSRDKVHKRSRTEDEMSDASGLG